MKKERKAELFLKFVSELISFYGAEDDVYTLEELIADNSFTEDSGLIHEIDLPGNIVVSLDITYKKKAIKIIIRNHTDPIRFCFSKTMEIDKLSVDLFLKIVDSEMKEWHKGVVEEYLKKADFYESVGRILQGEEG